jgi:hypothetical protein
MRMAASAVRLPAAPRNRHCIASLRPSQVGSPAKLVKMAPLLEACAAHFPEPPPFVRLAADSINR